MGLRGELFVELRWSADYFLASFRFQWKLSSSCVFDEKRVCCDFNGSLTLRD